MEMFDTEIKTLIKADGTPEQKEWVAEGTSQEMEAAITEMRDSWKAFCDVNKGTIAAYSYEWWKALMWLSCAENRLKEAFLGRDRSPKSIGQYHRWRMTIIHNRPYRANA
jgi:hypothetical protein